MIRPDVAAVAVGAVAAEREAPVPANHRPHHGRHWMR